MRSPWHDFKLRAGPWVKLQYIPRPSSVFRSGALRFDPFNLSFRERCLTKSLRLPFAPIKHALLGARGSAGSPPHPQAGMCCSHGPRHYSLTNATILSPSKQAWSSVLGSGVMHLCKPSEQYKHNRGKKAVFHLIAASRKHAGPRRTMHSPAWRWPMLTSQSWSSSGTKPIEQITIQATLVIPHLNKQN